MNAASRALIKMLALATLIVLVTSACTTDAGRATGRLRLPEHGLFPTSACQFDAVIRTGSLPTVVNVWASWCIPCRREASLLRVATDRYEGRIRFIGLDTRDSRKEALAFIRRFRIPYPNGFDPSGRVASHLNTLGVPTTFFYLRNDDLGFVHNGEIHAGDLRTKIDSLLQSSASERTPAP